MRVLLAGVIALGLSGCSLFLHSIERPTAEVRDVAVASAGLTGVTGSLALDVTNPNGFGVPLSGIDWQLAVGGNPAVSGKAELSQTIPAKGVAPITTSLTIDARDALAVAAALAQGAHTYEVTARLHFSTTVGPIDVEVHHTGELADAGGLLGLR